MTPRTLLAILLFCVTSLAPAAPADKPNVRTDRWRYTEWEDGRMGTELYDEKKDPGEHRSLASEPKQASTGEEMKKLLSAVRGY